MGQPFHHRFRVRYAECDSQGVVFNAHYVSYFDHTVTELWRQALGSYSAMLETGTDMVVAEVRVRYYGPAVFDDEIEVAAQIVRMGTTAITTRFTVRRVDEEAVLTEGEIRHVFVDLGTQAKKAIPEDIRRALSAYVVEDAAAVGGSAAPGG